MKIVTGDVVLQMRDVTWLLFHPHTILTMLQLLYIYTSSSQILCILPLVFLQMAAFVSSGCIKQDRAARHSLVRVETAEGRKRNARKVRSLGRF